MVSTTAGSDRPPSGKALSQKNAAALEPDGDLLFRSMPLGRALGTYLPATVAFRVINFGRVLLLTWWMSQHQFGLLNMVLLVVNVLTPLCSLGLIEAVTRYVPQYEVAGQLRWFVRRASRLLLVVTAGSLLLMVVFSGTLGEFFYAQIFTETEDRGRPNPYAVQLAVISAATIGLLVAYFLLLSILKGLRMIRALAMTELVHCLAFLALSIFAIALGRLSALSLTVMYGLSLAIPLAWFGARLIVSLRAWPITPPVDGEGLTRKLLRFSVWTTLAGVTWQVLVYYPAWFLNKIHGHEAVAVFSAVRQVGQFILVAAVAMSTVVATNVTKTWESEGRLVAERKLSLAFRAAGLALLVACVGLALLSEPIMRMFQPAYRPGAAVLPLQLLFFLIAAYLAFLPLSFQLIEKTRYLLWPWAAGVSANVVLALWLAGPYLPVVRETRLWRALSPFASAVFASGFSDPQGLGSASWCGVFAIALALVMCLVLIRAERCRLDRGMCVIIVAAALLAMERRIMTAGIVVLLLLAWRTSLVFSPQDRMEIAEHARRIFVHLPLWRRRGDPGA